MRRSKQVLFVAYYAPPMGGSGVQRPVKFAKYLAKLGWTIHWVCPKEGVFPYQDEGLQSDISDDNIHIHRIGGGTPQHSVIGRWLQSIYYSLPSKVAARLNSWIYFPDNKKGWSNEVFDESAKLITNHQIPLIFVTAPPFSSFSLATKLATKTGAKVVMDLRDDWLENQFHLYANVSRRQQMASLEAQELSKADAITVINKETKCQLASRHPELERRMSVITNGFDPDDLLLQTEDDDSRDGQKSTPSKWVYNGLFYRQQDPTRILKGFVRYLETKPKYPVQFVIQGDDGRRYQDVVKPVNDRFSWAGYLPHKESLRGVHQADVLWLHLSDMPHIDRVTPGKVFEYMGTGKPIFATIPEGITAEILREYGPVAIVHTTDPDELSQAMFEFEEARHTQQLPPVNKTFVGTFDREKLTHQLEQIFLNLTSEG